MAARYWRSWHTLIAKKFGAPLPISTSEDDDTMSTADLSAHDLSALPDSPFLVRELPSELVALAPVRNSCSDSAHLCRTCFCANAALLWWRFFLQQCIDRPCTSSTFYCCCRSTNSFRVCIAGDNLLLVIGGLRWSIFKVRLAAFLLPRSQKCSGICSPYWRYA